MNVNFPILLLAAIVPLLMGFIWYHPKTFANAWMKEADMTEEKIKSGNMGLIFGVTFVFSILLAFSIQFMVIHQFSLYSLFYGQAIDDPNSEVGIFFKSILERVGNSFRTFKHGMLHGFLGGLFSALPILGINALFERKSFKYIFIHAGYWIITMMLMGGIICQFA